MDLNNLVTIIPELFLYIIPGYIVVRTKKTYRSERDLSNFDTILQSIVYSFIIMIIYDFLLIIPYIDHYLRGDLQKSICSLILSVLMAWLLVKTINSPFGIWIGHVFDKNLVPFASVWRKAMESENGAWAIVYLKNGLVYRGMLINYTADPNDNTKEITLSNFLLAVQKNNPDSNDEFLMEIYNHENNDRSLVLLDKENILSIEIFKD